MFRLFLVIYLKALVSSELESSFINAFNLTLSFSFVYFFFSQGNNRYEDWKFGSECNILDVLQEHPSLRVPADLLLTQLPLLQPVSHTA